MAQRYHIGRSGNVARCNASEGNCPYLGAEHGDFETIREARHWAEDVNFQRAGGERNLLGARKKLTPEEEAQNAFSSLYLDGVYHESSLRRDLSQRLGLSEHEIQIRGVLGPNGLLPDYFEVFVPHDGGRVRVYSYAPKKLGVFYDTPATLSPASLISRSEYAERTIQDARNFEGSDPETALSMAFFTKPELRDPNARLKDSVYSVHDGIDIRHFDRRLNDVTERVEWEKATAELEGMRTRRESPFHPLGKDQRLAAIGDIELPRREVKTVESAKREIRARKPRRTLKWHAEQPVTESEAKIFSKVVSVEVVRGLPAKSRAEFLESHGEKVVRSPRSMMETMRKPKLSDGRMIAQANDKGSYFHRSGGEVAAITYDEDGNSTLHFHRGTSIRAKLDEDQDVYYLPTAARVLQTIRTGYGSELRQTL